MKVLNAREFIRDSVLDRRGGYIAAGLLALATGVFAITRMDAQPTGAVPESATAATGAEAEPAPAVAASGVTRVAKPEAVRALYLNAWAAGSSKKLARLIAVADSTEINAFVIDVKEGGEVSYETTVPLAKQVGASQKYIRNIKRLLEQMREHDIYPIARIVVFKDAVLAQARPEFAVKTADGSIWIDNKGKAWVDTFNRAVWDYNIAIAREAIDLGFSEVQWDYVRFPDAPRSYLAKAVWPAKNGRSKADGVREFMLYARDQLKDTGVPITADVFGLTVTTTGDMGIGQQWEKMVDAVDVILPMVYPSHFISGNYGLSSPNAAPYRTIRRSIEDAVARTRPVANAARIRPWLQDFTLGPPRYGPAHVRAQIEAVYDAGLTEWVLWHPGSNYSLAALAPEGGKAPEFEIPGGRGDHTRPARADSVVKPDTTPARTDTIR